MTSKNNNFALSPAKADRLYWLGRYSERVCIALHMLRKYYDEIIDNENSNGYIEFCSKMGIPCNYSNAYEFVHRYLYDTKSDVSIINMLERVKDNAILLREEIKSETLSFVELALNFMKRAGDENKGLYELQYVSDSMCAFWGAIEDKIFNIRSYDLIRVGKYVEKLDLYIRFGYSPERLANIMNRIDRLEALDAGLFNSDDVAELRRRIDEARLDKAETLEAVNNIYIS